MRSLRNAASYNVLVFLFLGVIGTGHSLASPFWFDDRHQNPCRALPEA